VLYTQGDRIFWYHASFLDFIFDPARSNFDNFMFWCNEPAHQNLLGESCFRVMKSGLRFNMGDIESSCLFDCDNAEALSEKIENNISAVLRYSTRHRTHHLPSPQLVDTEDLIFCISESMSYFGLRPSLVLRSRDNGLYLCDLRRRECTYRILNPRS